MSKSHTLGCFQNLNIVSANAWIESGLFQNQEEHSSVTRQPPRSRSIVWQPEQTKSHTDLQHQKSWYVRQGTKEGQSQQTLQLCDPEPVTPPPSNSHSSSAKLSKELWEEAELHF